MKRRTLIKGGLAGLATLYTARSFAHLQSARLPSIKEEPFLPTWDSLAQYRVPDWFRDAKFGIWAHWGPQCQPERGDWYARGMYQEGSDQYQYHCEKYGHPSKFGFKDVINEWKAERWDPEYLVGLYKKAGAKYFMALANHHDNLDLFDSKHQRWNSVNVGPKKDLMAGWAKAAKRQGLPLGVSVHSAHAWRWYETAQRSDTKGPMAGVPYDGQMTAKHGDGTWWQGYDPQELYAQNHPLSKDSLNDHAIHGQWNWGNGVYPPSKAYCDNFYDRTLDLIEKYDPELVYFDDTVLPLWPVSDAGLRIAAHLYNKSIRKNGKLSAVVCGKILDAQQRKCMVWDIERGQSNAIEPLPWQTDTCLGQWHYDRRVYDNNHYKSAKTVIHTLVDIISKNGNLMLNVPLRGDGSIDDKELAIVEGIGKWIAINGEGVYGTRPWKVFGEGPAIESVAPLSAQGFNEGKGKPFGPADIRFVVKGNTLYATLLGWPSDNTALVKTLKAGAHGKVEKVSLLGHGKKLNFTQTADELKVSLPEQPPGDIAFILKLEGSFV